ncbi:MAG TPA: hypothetical protein VKN99_08285, partial [Polyangia bacterium]|nr:hypothetical protein [Polyangia bacterium]
GKSSLVVHARQLAEAHGRVCFWTTPDASGAARPWAPFRQLARELLGLRGKPSLEMIDTAMKRAELDPANLTGLAELFGVVGDFSGLEPVARRRECMASALAVVHTAAARQPALLVFEDVDRYDAPSAELVSRLLDYPGEGPLCVLATRARGSFQVAGPQVEVLELAAFDEHEVEELQAHALSEAPHSLTESIMAASAGLPLHVEQILRFIAEGGGEPYPSLADTIGARIARLPQEARTLLQAVAIAGGEASASLLRAAQVGGDLGPEGLLAKRGFAVAASGVVRIVHPLFAEVAYEGIPEEVRRELHLKLWRALENQHAEPSVLARHAYFARDRKAVPLLERAGERAQHEFDDPGAATHFRRAVELQRWALLEGAVDAEETFVRLSVKLGESLHQAGDMGGAEGVLREALGYAQGHSAAEARVRLGLARLSMAWDQLERAERELRAGLRVAFKAGDAALLGELYLEFGGLCVRRGDLEAAIDELSEGINLTTGGEGPEADVGPAVLWRLVARHAETLQQAGDTPAALAVAKHALRHARRVRSLVGEARVHTLLGLLYDAGREPKPAADHRAEALALMRRLGDRRSTAELLLADAQTVLQRSGMRRDTLMRLQEASQLAAQVGWREGVERSEQVIRQSSLPPKTRTLAPQGET